MIIATAGHVDHGKTTLVKAITGIDTDRLPEEKNRGLSIDLGFAYLPHPQQDNCTLGFIDVPGHEKFVRNMIAGVGGVDLAVLVVAADDGPMPQTREHLAILELLNVESLIVVVTKTDLVAADEVERVSAQLVDLLKLSTFSRAEFAYTSAEKPETIDALRDRLLDLALQHSNQAASGYFRLAIDRSFSITGAGTVVTGTVMSGSVSTDDVLQLLSSGADLRVRGIRAQDEQVRRAVAGQRCALNISGSSLRHAIPKRGDWLTANKSLALTTSIDVSLRYVGSLSDPGQNKNQKQESLTGFKHWTAGHLHLATASSTCRVALLDTELLNTGETGLARLYCDKPLGAVSGDKFVLRDQSARTTIAGGVVIDPLPPGRGRSKLSRLQLLRAMQGDGPSQVLKQLLDVSPAGVDLHQFIARVNCTAVELRSFCNDMSVIQCEAGSQWWGVSPQQWTTLKDKLLRCVAQWHKDYPLLLGASLDQLRKASKPVLSESVTHVALEALINDGKLVRQSAVYRCEGWHSTLDDHHESCWSKIEPQMQNCGNTAPRVIELAELLEISSDEVLKLLNTFVAHGRLYRVSPNRYYLPATLLPLAKIAETLAQQDNFTVAAYRDKSAIGRNLVIELLEFFDRLQFTRRSGQQRVVLRPAEHVFQLM